MAGIYIKTDAPHYLKVYIGDLDPSWTTDMPQRTATWYITNSSNSGLGSFIGSQKLGASRGSVEYTSSEDDPFTYEDLLPDTEYKITCMIVSPAFPNGDPGVNVTLKAVYSTLVVPEITEFTINQPPTGRKYFTTSWYGAGLYFGITKVMFEARQSGTSKWWRKATYLIEGETTDTEPIVTDEFGDYEFRMILDTRGYQVVSDIVTATAVSYDYNYACGIISSERTTTSISVYLANFDTKWIDLPERTATWYICTDGEFNVSRYRWHAIADGASNTKNQTLKFSGLKPDTRYYIKCHITSDDSFDGIKGWDNEFSISLSTYHPIKAFSVQTTREELPFKWMCTLNETYDEPLEYKLMFVMGNYSSSNPPKDEDLVQISGGYIPVEGMSDYLIVNAPKYGHFTVCLAVYVDDCEYRKYLYRSIVPPQITTTNFNVVTDSEALEIVVSWNVDWLQEGDTNYELRLFKSTGGLVEIWEDVCLYNNALTIQLPEYGEYFISIFYDVGGFSRHSFSSDDFTVYSTNRPWVWDWSATTQRQKAYSAIEDRTAMDIDEMDTFSYVVWDEFVDKVAEFMDYKGWLDMNLPKDMYGFTTADTYRVMLEGSKTGSNRALTVNMFNAVRYCIGSMNTFNVSVTPNSIKAHYEAKGTWDMQPKEIVYGAYFLDLAEWLNNVE